MNKHIETILNSIKIKKFINIICNKADLKDDLFQFCILKLLEKDINKLNGILSNTNKSVEDYFLGMLVYQIRSNTSEFYKVYRNYGFTKSVFIDVDYIFDILEYEETEYVEDDILISKVDSAMLRCDPLKIDLFKMKYYEDKTYKEISEYYNINIDSVINKVKSVKKSIKDMLNSEMSFSELRKKDHELRRVRLGKIAITDEVKQDIFNRYINGEKKVNLAKEYQISYPLVIKIIKEHI